jgi:hypothetical protein
MTTAKNPGDYVLRAGLWTIDKDPREDEWYGLKIYGDISAMGTAISSVTAVVKGVTISSQAEIVDPAGYVRVKLTGLDVTSDEAVNWCTYMITCANGESFPRSIYFRNKVK